MQHVHLIRSVSHPDQTYIGITGDLKRRLRDHNSGDSPHTLKYLPWELVTALAFTDDSDFNAWTVGGHRNWALH